MVALPSIADAKNCKKGQPCGNSCISWSKTCRIGSSSSYRASSGPGKSYRPPSAGHTTTKSRQTVVSEYLTMRTSIYDKPGFSANVVGDFDEGTLVYVYGRQGQWVRISSPDATLPQWIPARAIAPL